LKDLDSESGSGKQKAGDEANVSMELVATVTSEVEPQSDSEGENEICLRVKEKQRSWYVDSGCSRHMTREKSMFPTLTMKEGEDVKFGGNQTSKVMGTWTIGKIIGSRHFVVHARKGKLLNQLLEQNTLSQPPDP